ncbi:hypothetical protein ACFLT5_03595, partial [Chloroflexota bacterium]
MRSRHALTAIRSSPRFATLVRLGRAPPQVGVILTAIRRLAAKRTGPFLVLLLTAALLAACGFTPG